MAKRQIIQNTRGFAPDFPNGKSNPRTGAARPHSKDFTFSIFSFMKDSQFPFYGCFKNESIIISGVQSINNVNAIVDKVENVLVNTHIFDLIDIGVYVVYALYSRFSLSL